MQKILSVLLILAFALLSACSGPESGTSGGKKVIPVKVVEAAQREVRQSLAAIGHIEPSATVNVSAQVSGQLLETYIKPGQYVTEGDKLFKIDPRTFLANLNQAEAALAREQARLKQAQQDLGRNRSLVKNEYLSRQQYDQSKTDVATLQATIAEYQAALEYAKLQLGYTNISAPISGRVGEILVDPGNIVKANDVTLLVINTITPAEASFSVPEKFLPELNRKVREGKVEVRVLPEGDKGEPVSGTLTVIDNTVDRSTGSITMRAAFRNADERLWPGQFVRVSITLDSLKSALVIPFACVLEGISGQYVYVVKDDNTVQEFPVRTELLEDGNLLVHQGLKAGDKIVTDGQLNLYPGAPVRLVQ